MPYTCIAVGVLIFAGRAKISPSSDHGFLRRKCKAVGLPLIGWHSFRLTHAKQLAEVGESLRTAQSLLGHSDLERMLNVYTHGIPDAQRRAVDKIAEVLFGKVQKISAAIEN